MAEGRSLKNFFVVTGILIFFFGLPAAGLVFFFKDMWGKIEGEARPMAQTAAHDILSGGYPVFLQFASKTLIKKLPEADYKKTLAPYGEFQKLGEAKHIKSWVREHDDNVWQYTKYQFPATFTKGDLVLTLTITRVYQPTWYVDEFTIAPAGAAKS